MSQPERRYAAAIATGRRAKDEHLRTAPGSPLRRSDATVDRLHYFPVDARYRIVGRIRPAPTGDDPIALDTSDGRQRVARRAGILDFELDGRPLALTGFALGSTPPGSLFVPFSDTTSGHETYGSGRYLDLEAEPDGTVVLDFNLAYQPYCAYSGAYSCPLPPAENRLPVPVHAGERLSPAPARPAG